MFLHNNNFECTFFLIFRRIISHLKKEHANVIDWVCDKCNKSFYSAARLIKHHCAAHLLGEYLCSVEGCKHTSASRYNAYSHFNAAHLKKSGKLKKGVVFRPEAIQQNQVHVDDKKSMKIDKEMFETFEHNCPQKSCGGYFVTLEKLQNHLRNKHNVKQFQCTALQCEDSFDHL